MVSDRVPLPPCLNFIGINVGGTKILAGRVREDGQVVARRQVPTELGSGSRILRRIGCGLVADLAAGDALDGVGVGFPGTIDQRRGAVVHASNLPMADVPRGSSYTVRRAAPCGSTTTPTAPRLPSTIAAPQQDTEHSRHHHPRHRRRRRGRHRGAVRFRGATGAGAELGHIVIDRDGPPARAPAPATATSRRTRRARRSAPPSRRMRARIPTARWRGAQVAPRPTAGSRCTRRRRATRGRRAAGGRRRRARPRARHPRPLLRARGLRDRRRLRHGRARLDPGPGPARPGQRGRPSHGRHAGRVGAPRAGGRDARRRRAAAPDMSEPPGGRLVVCAHADRQPRRRDPARARRAARARASWRARTRGGRTTLLGPPTASSVPLVHAAMTTTRRRRTPRASSKRLSGREPCLPSSRDAGTAGRSPTRVTSLIRGAAIAAGHDVEVLPGAVGGDGRAGRLRACPRTSPRLPRASCPARRGRSRELLDEADGWRLTLVAFEAPGRLTAHARAGLADARRRSGRSPSAAS